MTSEVVDPAPAGEGREPQVSGKARCGARKRDGSGDTCRRYAGQGTDHVGVGPCRLHGGNTRNHVVSAQKAQAAEILERYGTPRRIDPRDGLIEEYWRTAGAVAYCERRVQALPDRDLVWGVAEETDGFGEDGGGSTTKRKAAVNVWLQLYQAERKKFSDLALDIIRLGLEAQRDAAAERQSLQLAGVIRLFVAELGLSEEQQARVPAALRAATAALTASEARAVGAAS